MGHATTLAPLAFSLGLVTLLFAAFNIALVVGR